MPIYRSDVVGSLLRPPFLLDARDQVERGALTPAAFKRIEDEAVNQAVALQQFAGLDVITDGEMRRYAFFGHLVDALEGFDKHAGWSITFRDDAQRRDLRVPWGSTLRRCGGWLLARRPHAVSERIVVGPASERQAVRATSGSRRARR